MTTSVQPLRVALLGCGVVGSSVATMLVTQAQDLHERVGRPLELVGIAVRRLDRDRATVPVDPSLFTTDAAELVTRAGGRVTGQVALTDAAVAPDRLADYLDDNGDIRTDELRAAAAALIEHRPQLGANYIPPMPTNYDSGQGVRSQSAPSGASWSEVLSDQRHRQGHSR